MKGAIFDLDGTILDSMGIWYDAGERYLRSIGTEPEENLGETLFSMTLEEAAGYAKERYHLRQTKQEIIDGVLDIVRDFYYDEVQAKEGAPEFLASLSAKGIPLAAATAGNRELAEAALRRLGIWAYFKEVLTCTEVGAGKHEPDIYRKAQELLGTEEEETWVFEDVLYALETAKRAGFRTIGVKDESSRGDWNRIETAAEYCLNSWKDAVGLLDEEKI